MYQQVIDYLSGTQTLHSENVTLVVDLKTTGSSADVWNWTQIGNGTFYVLLWISVFVDLVTNGVGGKTNSTWLSFTDSFSHCCYWAAFSDIDLSFEMRVLGTVLSKFGANFVTNRLLGEPPSFAQLDRLMAFAFAMSLAHTNLPLAGSVRAKHGLWRVLFIILGALYKSRKLRKSVTKSKFKVFTSLLVGICEVDLTGWLVVASRSFLTGADPLLDLGEFVLHHHQRFVITFVAIIYALTLDRRPTLVRSASDLSVSTDEQQPDETQSKGQVARRNRKKRHRNRAVEPRTLTGMLMHVLNPRPLGLFLILAIHKAAVPDANGWLSIQV